jgi:hypothetical protein
MVTVVVPVFPVAGCIVTVMEAPLGLRMTLAFGNNVVFELVAVTNKLASSS